MGVGVGEAPACNLAVVDTRALGTTIQSFILQLLPKKSRNGCHVSRFQIPEELLSDKTEKVSVTSQPRRCENERIKVTVAAWFRPWVWLGLGLGLG